LNRKSQCGIGAGTQPRWVRAVALFCVLLTGAIGVAQAAHMHGEWLPKHAAQVASSSAQSGAAGEESCPLCIAMHSALPVSGFTAVIHAIVSERHVAAFTGHTPETPWHFAAFSRPPPASLAS
jgi:hypothetical protein